MWNLSYDSLALSWLQIHILLHFSKKIIIQVLWKFDKLTFYANLFLIMQKKSYQNFLHSVSDAHKLYAVVQKLYAIVQKLYTSHELYKEVVYFS